MDKNIEYQPNIKTDNNYKTNLKNDIEKINDIEIQNNNIIDNTSDNISEETTNIDNDSNILVSDKNKLNIEYQPSKKIDSTYNTTAKNRDNSVIDNNNKDSNNSTTDDVIKNKLNDLINDLNSIFNTSKGLTDNLYNLIMTNPSGITYMINSFNPDDISSPDFPSIQYTTQQNNNNGVKYVDDDSNLLDVPDNIFPDLKDTIININNGESNETLLDKQYQIDLINIFKDYTFKLNNVLNKFFTYFLQSVIDCNMVDNYKDLLGDTDLSIFTPTKYQFLIDNIVKNNIMIDQKIRLQDKIYDIDNFITTARKIVLSNELRKRYSDIDYVSDDSYLEMNKNNILSDIKREYNKKYDTSLYNMYKYLNSSVILINETLNMVTSNVESKSILINEKGEN